MVIIAAKRTKGELHSWQQKFKRARHGICQRKLEEEERLGKLERVTQVAGAFDEANDGPSVSRQMKNTRI